eukprot:scaffold20.g7868.t1
MRGRGTRRGSVGVNVSCRHPAWKAGLIAARCCRKAELRRRAERLRWEQEQVERELRRLDAEEMGQSASGASGGKHAQAEDPGPGEKQGAEPSLESMLAELRGVGEEAAAADDDEGAQMAALLLEMLQDKGFLCEPETAEEFKARMRASVEDYMFGTKGIKHRQGTSQRVRPEVRTDIKADRPFQDVPVIPDEIRGIIPAPYLPPEVEERARVVERVAYVLRRAHMESTSAGAGLAALAARGLLVQPVEAPPPAAAGAGSRTEGAGEPDPLERLWFGDPWVELWGEEGIREYLGRLDAAGATFHLVQITLRCTKYDPHPTWDVIVDCCLDLPYPVWYMKYRLLHPGAGGRPPHFPPDDASIPVEGWGPAAGRRLRHELVPQDPAALLEGGAPGQHLPYPRRPLTATAAEQQGTAHLRWLHRRPGGAGPGGGSGPQVHWVPAEPGQPGCAADLAARFQSSEGADGRGSSSAQPDYSAVEAADILQPQAWAGLAGNDQTSASEALAGGAAGSGEPSRGEPSTSGSAPTGRQQRGKGRRGKRRPGQEAWEKEEEPVPWSWNPERRERQREAAGLLRALLGDEYDAAMAQLPQPGRRRGRSSNAAPPLAAQPGTAFLEGGCLTANVTLRYTVDWEAGPAVDGLSINWGAVHGVVTDVREVADLYLAAVGLLEWEEGLVAPAPAGAGGA